MKRTNRNSGTDRERSKFNGGTKKRSVATVKKRDTRKSNVQSLKIRKNLIVPHLVVVLLVLWKKIRMVVMISCLYVNSLGTLRFLIQGVLIICVLTWIGLLPTTQLMVE